VKAIVALGNPGDRYRDTRHNVGWWLAERLRSAWSLPAFRSRAGARTSEGRRGEHPVRIVEPLTYVNLSGRVVRDVIDQTGLSPSEDLLVLVDDVSLPPGTLRLRESGSSGGHNGLASIEEAVGTREYARLRIGVGRPHDDRIDLADWVLAPLPGAEEEAVLETFPRAIEAVDCWLAEGAEAAMSRYNG
jgi:peptidyl-tRNA hydrolase, PTH1 family